MFEGLTDGKIERDTDQFKKLRVEAKLRLDQISMISGKRLRQRLRRHMTWINLNKRLADFGWAIKRNGKMFEVKVRGEQPPQAIPQKQRPTHGSIEDINQRALAHFTSTGKLIDPRDGSQLPISERYRFGIS